MNKFKITIEKTVNKDAECFLFDNLNTLLEQFERTPQAKDIRNFTPIVRQCVIAANQHPQFTYHNEATSTEYNGYFCGQGHNHVWICHNKPNAIEVERIIIINYQD